MNRTTLRDAGKKMAELASRYVLLLKRARWVTRGIGIVGGLLIITGTVHVAALGMITRRCRATATDCLALEQAIALRANGLPTQSCEAADRLAEELSTKTGVPRRHYSLVSDAEHFGPDASAIHLSYARLDFWNLHRAVHEFGHLWAEEYGSAAGRPQAEFIHSLPSWDPAHAKEFFADVMGAYLAGAAYVYGCLLLDFTPDRSKTDTHPSGDERAYAVLAAIDRLTNVFDSVTRAQQQQLTEELRQFWETVRNEAGLTGEPPNARELKAAIGSAVDSLANQIPAARYYDLSGANQLREVLGRPNGTRPAGASGADILNGAWLRRRDEPNRAALIGTRALAMLASV